LNANLYDLLSEYNIQKQEQVSGHENESIHDPQSTYTLRLTIPPFPIYGKATASPEGGITFEAPEYNANGVTENYEVLFFGKKHKVYSTNEYDLQINITSGKSYGWLKIAGESMNIALPIPIEDQDYVLFCKTDELEFCTKKIVVATQPGLDEQYPLLIVKRLVAISPKSKSVSDTWKKYYLHSESSWDDYKDDIEFTNENQLIGEVIAVAKPVK
jgi:hypothetical protein